LVAIAGEYHEPDHDDNASGSTALDTDRTTRAAHVDHGSPRDDGRCPLYGFASDEDDEAGRVDADEA
jgi:hypothetical protein